MDEKISSKDQIITTLKKTGALKFGDFTLASGAKSKYYIDLRILPNFPNEFEILIDIALDYIKQNIADIEGIVAIPLAAGVMYSQGILLSPAMGAVLMSLSTVIVAINARLLRVEKEI